MKRLIITGIIILALSLSAIGQTQQQIQQQMLYQQQQQTLIQQNQLYEQQMQRQQQQTYQLPPLRPANPIQNLLRGFQQGQRQRGEE